VVEAFAATGLERRQARERVWFVDVMGLVVKQRSDLADHNLPYAHEHPPAGFIEAMQSIKPNVLIGATGQPGTFTREVVELMSKLNSRPTIFALSNPTSRAECTPEQAYEWSAGKVIFASGSPFPPVEYDGRRYRPGQGNNVYVFPGVGLAAVACKAQRITEEMFLVAARTLAGLVSEDDLAAGAIYPPLTRIREISLAIAEAVVEKTQDLGLARAPMTKDVRATIANGMYDPTY
jgi:malate dehydrogenase (oxaloacetate-decarboxylating)(NADP+)